ncbi:MAG: acyl-ACP desaturase [Actinomycetes bacterium]
MPIDLDSRLLVDLEPVVAGEVDRHFATARDWYPHEYVPWSEGETFAGVLDGKPWEPAQERFSGVARTSLIVNLLTEDNLPSYHFEIASSFGRDGAWGTWVHRWTAEEGRHAQVLRDYLTVTRAIDPRMLEDARMTHMQEGFAAIKPGMLHGLAYVSFQELATRVSHRNTGRATQDPVAEQLLTRIALDENLHMLFYRNVMAAALDVAPDPSMRAITDMVVNFAMPGHGIPGFQRKAVEIAVAGIYDLRQHLDEVVAPVLRAWRIMERDDFGPEGEAARDELTSYIEQLEVSAARFEVRRATLAARLFGSEASGS